MYGKRMSTTKEKDVAIAKSNDRLRANLMAMLPLKKRQRSSFTPIRQSTILTPLPA
jgi:hypothetical protein